MIRTMKILEACMKKLDGISLSIDDLVEIAKGNQKVSISEASKDKIIASRLIVEDMVKHKKHVYGVNTGFGKLCDEKISCEALNSLQVNLLRSHACGVGETFSIDVVRAMMALRINALVKGYSGIRLETIEKLLELLNHNLIPVVYTQGSLGASGDLVPLAHMALPLIGEGEVWVNNERVHADKALKEAGVKPLEELHAKEGLALINGTQAMTAVAALALDEAENLLHHATLSASLTMEALKSIIDAFDERVHKVRNHEGQQVIAQEIRKYLEESQNITHQGELRTQDAYSIRCIPQVHGAIYDTINYVRSVIEKEMNAVTDNPIIFEGEEAISAGNFHGQPIALVMDYLAIAMSEIANISERRIERLVNPCLNGDLPAFLVKIRGLNSGFMIAQYAAASLVSENKILSHPASVDSIPSSANQEDHVSMGTIAARKARQIIKHGYDVIAIEVFTACQAIDFEAKDKLSPSLKVVHEKVRKEVPFIEEDQMMQPLIEIVKKIIDQGILIKEVKHG